MISSGLRKVIINVLTIHLINRANQLRSSIIDRLAKNQINSPASALAFFYCDGNYAEKQDSRYILGSLIRQLIPASSLMKDTAELKLIKSQYDRNLGGGSPPLDTLLFTLEWISHAYEQVYIIIDGLDECENRKTLVNNLSNIPTDAFNLFITSRPENDIVKAFGEKPNMGMDNKYVQQDIAAHIKIVLDEDEDFQDLDVDLKNEIAEKLQAKNEGMYDFPYCGN